MINISTRRQRWARPGSHTHTHTHARERTKDTDTTTATATDTCYMYQMPNSDTQQELWGNRAKPKLSRARKKERKKEESGKRKEKGNSIFWILTLGAYKSNERKEKQTKRNQTRQDESKNG